MRGVVTSASRIKWSVRDRSMSCSSPGQPRMWRCRGRCRRSTRLFKRLSGFARLIIFDKRGTGMSDKVEDGFSLEARMDDVRAVMDAAGSERAAIVGVSEGVPMSVLFAATYPDRVGAMVLYGGLARMLWAPDYPWGTPEAEYLQEIADERSRFGRARGQTRSSRDRGLPMPAVTRSPRWRDISATERARAPTRRSTG